MPEKELFNSIAAGVFLIGLAILLHIGFQPWLLVLVGIMAIITGIGEYYVKKSEKRM